MYKFRLFIFCFSSASSRKTIKQVVTMFDRYFKPGNYSLSIVDVMEDPETARASLIFATPVLIKSSPGDYKKVFGSLDDAAKVMENLGCTLIM